MRVRQSRSTCFWSSMRFVFQLRFLPTGEITWLGGGSCPSWCWTTRPTPVRAWYTSGPRGLHELPWQHTSGQHSSPVLAGLMVCWLARGWPASWYAGQLLLNTSIRSILNETGSAPQHGYSLRSKGLSAIRHERIWIDAVWRDARHNSDNNYEVARREW